MLCPGDFHDFFFGKLFLQQANLFCLLAMCNIHQVVNLSTRKADFVDWFITDSSLA